MVIFDELLEAECGWAWEKENSGAKVLGKAPHFASPLCFRFFTLTKGNCNYCEILPEYFSKSTAYSPKEKKITRPLCQLGEVIYSDSLNFPILSKEDKKAIPVEKHLWKSQPRGTSSQKYRDLIKRL